MVDLHGLHSALEADGRSDHLRPRRGHQQHIFQICRGLSAEFRGIAVDLRGYGDSEKPATGYSIPQFSNDLIKLVDVLQIKKAVGWCVDGRHDSATAGAGSS